MSPTTHSGANILALTGADAASFEIVGNALYLKVGAASPIFRPRLRVNFLLKPSDHLRRWHRITVRNKGDHNPTPARARRVTFPFSLWHGRPWGRLFVWDGVRHEALNTTYQRLAFGEFDGSNPAGRRRHRYRTPRCLLPRIYGAIPSQHSFYAGIFCRSAACSAAWLPSGSWAA